MDDSQKYQTPITYLYILHSKDFDIDGPDTCYKFGYTTRIEMRKFNSCYQTALKYPPTYKYWYEIMDFSGQFLETLIKRVLINHRYIGHTTAEKTYGTEMFCIKLNELRQIVVNCLKSNAIDFIQHDTDNFERPPTVEELYYKHIEYEDAELDQIAFIIKLIQKINKHEKLDSDDLKFIKDVEWVYNHNKSTHTQMCVFCNRKLERDNFAIYNEKFGIHAYIGSSCINKINNKINNKTGNKINHITYANSKVTESLTRMGFSPDIIMRSDDKIANIVNDASYYIYSFLLNDKDDAASDLSASVTIDDNILQRIFDNNGDFSPLSAICMIVTHMYRVGYTFITKQELVDEITAWNGTYKKYWDATIIAKYLIDNKHDQLSYDPQNCIFILTKYHNMEKTFIDQWKLLNIPDNKPGPVDMRNKFIVLQKKISDDNENKMDLEYIDKQCLIFDSVATNKISILSGIAGSGKSTLSSFICQEYSQIQYNIIQLAPTGKAVSVIKGKNAEIEFKTDQVYTIHSFLINTKVQAAALKSPHKNILFHIDETSMVDLGLFVRLLTLLIKLNKEYAIKILISGDHDQLPPVGFGHVFKYLIENIGKNSTNLVKLDENKRLDCKLNEWLINKFMNNKCTNIAEFLKFAENKSKKWNKKKYIPEKIMPYHTDKVKELCVEHYQFVTYNNKITAVINNIIKGGAKKRYPQESPDMKKVSIGDRIMILKNGYDDEDCKLIYYNGKEGVITDIIKNNRKQIVGFKMKPYIFKNGALVDTSRDEQTINFTNQHLETYSINQLITYSWCKTVHKTQGDGFDNVCLILDGSSIDKTLLNTALTRVKKDIVILYADGWLTKNLTRNIKNTNSFLPNLYNGTPLELKHTDKTELKEKLLGLLPKFSYNIKYMIEHNIEITACDLSFLKKKINTYWDVRAYNIFANELARYSK